MMGSMPVTLIELRSATLITEHRHTRSAWRSPCQVHLPSPSDPQTETAATSEVETTNETSDAPVTESAKEVFAAALEKKKAAGQSRSAHLDGHGGVGGATASHKATRTFRRKSG